MSRVKPIVAKCSFCKEWFLIKFVSYYNRFSLKNDWNYWTQKGTEKKIKKGTKKICDACLKKNRTEINELIVVPKVKHALRVYVSRFSRKGLSKTKNETL